MVSAWRPHHLVLSLPDEGLLLAYLPYHCSWPPVRIVRNHKTTENKSELSVKAMEVYETLGTNGTAYSISSLELFQCIGF